jgi:hypothetical protein
MSLNSTNHIQRKYSPLTCDILSELRNSGEYCDVILRTDDQHLFKVHRAILCCKRNNFILNKKKHMFGWFFFKHVVLFFEHFLLME